MIVTVQVADQASAELLAALQQLLPQLSPNATIIDETRLEALIASPVSTLMVAYSDGSIVGTLTLVIFKIPSGVRAWIEDVVVDQSVRGQGVGEALTKAAIEEARRRNVETIDLTSRPARGAANKLYRKLGFEQRVTNVYRFFIEGR